MKVEEFKDRFGNLLSKASNLTNTFDRRNMMELIGKLAEESDKYDYVTDKCQKDLEDIDKKIDSLTDIDVSEETLEFTEEIFCLIIDIDDLPESMNELKAKASIEIYRIQDEAIKNDCVTSEHRAILNEIRSKVYSGDCMVESGIYLSLKPLDDDES